jgi:hypothetical protein
VAQSNIERRNQEINEVWQHLRKINRHESSYVIEFISQHYFIGKDTIYSILAMEFNYPFDVSNASLIFKLVKANEYQSLQTYIPVS